MKLLFLLYKDLIIYSLLCFLSSALGCFLLVKFKVFKERVREELSHKQDNNNVSTCGGMIFIGVTLIFSALIKERYLLSLSSAIFLGGLTYFRSNILHRKKDFFIYLFLFLAVNYSLILSLHLDQFSIIFLTVFLSLILGYFDDITKINNGSGLSESVLFKSQGVIGLIPVLFNFYHDKTYLSFLNFKLDFGLLYIPIGLFIFSAVVNSANLTDGLNGGLGVPTIVINLFFISYFFKSLFGFCFNPIFFFEDSFLNFPVLLIFSLIPFLFFNFRGLIFMANIGSVSIGAMIATIALLSKTELLLPIFCVLLMLETLSCIIQVYSIRKFKKKILLFAPFHHHFELLGWSNRKIVLLMTSMTFIGCFISYFLV